MGNAARHAQSGLHYPLGGSAQLPVRGTKKRRRLPGAVPIFLFANAKPEMEPQVVTENTQFPGLPQGKEKSIFWLVLLRFLYFFHVVSP